MKLTFRPVIFLFVILVVWLFLHEMSHYTIYEEYGCQPSFHLDLVAFHTDATCPGISTERYTSLLLAQGNVENLGYQLLIPILLLVLMITQGWE